MRLKKQEIEFFRNFYINRGWKKNEFRKMLLF
jgi:hypothetical protein